MARLRVSSAAGGVALQVETTALAITAWLGEPAGSPVEFDERTTGAIKLVDIAEMLEPGQKVALPISLVAAIPGDYTGPASRAYRNYTDEQKVWVEPLLVTITPVRK